MQETTDGKPKVVDIVDCSGSGDVVTSTEMQADADGTLEGLFDRKLAVSSSWSNPSGKWRVGAKPLFELYPGGCKRKVERKRKARALQSFTCRRSHVCLREPHDTQRQGSIGLVIIQHREEVLSLLRARMCIRGCHARA